MKKNLMVLWGLCVAAIITALVLTSATFAWFTANREVGTDRVTARAGSNELDLEVSQNGGEDFRAAANNEVPLKAQTAPLMPVSTADLKSFVYNSRTVDDFAEDFLPTQDESFYYHDTIYLRAKAEGMPSGTKVALYLDKTPIVENLEGELITAARLGLTFDEASPVIITLSDVNEGTGNTRPGGVAIGDGQVLSYNSGNVTAAKDPAISLTDVQLSPNDTPGKQPIATLELNHIYAVDIFFYLEGCDPDCTSEKVAMDSAALTLAFYGMMVSEEAGL